VKALALEAKIAQARSKGRGSAFSPIMRKEGGGESIHNALPLSLRPIIITVKARPVFGTRDSVL
jgi:hypothetical protein